MSRIAKMPIPIESGVQCIVDGNIVRLSKAGSDSLECPIFGNVSIEQDSKFLTIVFDEAEKKYAGTLRANVANIMHGLTKGFEKKLILVGVGYKAQVQGKVLSLNLGYSHPISFEIPEGVQMSTPSATEIIIKSADKQRVGQVAAKIRSFRSPEPYKGKGIRYSDEVIILKETKKK